MECFYCRSYNRKYYCCRCLTEKLTDHNDELKAITTESKQAIQEAETYLEKTSTMHALMVDKKQRSNNIRRLMEEQKRTLRESDKMTRQVERLRNDMDHRRSNLEQGRQSLQHAQQSLIHSTATDTNADRTLATATAAVQKSWLRTYKVTAKTRQILVKEAASLFDLKLGVVEDGDDDALYTSPLTKIGGATSYSNGSGPYQPPHPSTSTDTYHNNTSGSNSHPAEDRQPSMDETNQSCGSLQNSTMAFTKSNRAYGKVQSYEDLYICGVTLPARLIDVSRYPKEELNSAIGYTTQMLDLVVRYLGIKLPFCLFRKDIYTYIRSIPHSRIYPYRSKMPLFLEDDKNFRRFLIGVSMLNYNIVYLCFTQGIHIPLSQVANTLQNLMAGCNAPGLGLRSHAMIYQGLTNLDFTFDFEQVLRQTALRYRCGSRTASGNQQGIADKQERTERFFKVRRSAFLGDHYHDDEDDDDDPSDLTDDNEVGDNVEDEDDDDDEDDDIDVDKVSNHHSYQHRRHHQRQEEDRQDEATSSSNENWNLVDVMPAFATQSGQNESIFSHLGAAHLGATIMPGVLGMMENLGNVGGRHTSNHSGSSSTFRVGETDEAITNHRRTSLQRRW